MNPITAALQAAVAQLIQSVVGVVVPFLVGLFQKHVVPQHGLQALPKGELRAQARTWVKDMLAEIGNAMVSKNVLPVWVQPFLPLLESALEQAVEKALDAAGL